MSHRNKLKKAVGSRRLIWLFLYSPSTSRVTRLGLYMRDKRAWSYRASPSRERASNGQGRRCMTWSPILTHITPPGQSAVCCEASSSILLLLKHVYESELRFLSLTGSVVRPSERHCRETNFKQWVSHTMMMIIEGTSSASKKKKNRIPWSESTLVPSRNEADVYPIAPYLLFFFFTAWKTALITAYKSYESSLKIK